MPRFTALHALRVREEDEARRQVGLLEMQRAGLLDDLQRMTSERLLAAAGVGTPMREQYLIWWEALQVRLDSLAASVAAKEGEIASARENLQEAHRRTKTLAKLRELDRAREQRQRGRREQRASDEFAASRHLGRRNA